MQNATHIISTPFRQMVYKFIFACLVVTASVTGVALHTSEANAASALDDSIYNAARSSGNGGLLTPWESEAKNAVQKYGFSGYKESFKASTKQVSGTYPVYRLYNKSNGNFYYTIWPTERDTAVSKYGYTYQQIDFYADRSDTADTEPVYVFSKGSYHRFAMSAADQAELVASGYQLGKIAFYAAPAEQVDPIDPVSPEDADGKFSIAVIPDTQVETYGNDNRFANRTQWLADNKNDLDLRFVGHTGDVVNWGWLVPSQFAVASSAATKLEQANIPYAFSVGNHDTRAVGHNGVSGSRSYGGSAYVNNPECVERLSVALCKTGLLQHDTREFNNVFNKNRYTSVAGEYEAGKVENIYSTFEAVGKKWMMLTLEMNARAEVVDWAKNVVATHPDYNVMVQTHQYMNSDGSISTSGGYGDGSRSGQYLFDTLIKQYPNIIATFSGHVGSSAIRTDTGVNGNKIVSYLQAFHSSTTNPVRLLEIDTNTNSISTSVYAPYTDETMVGKSTQSDVNFVSAH